MGGSIPIIPVFTQNIREAYKSFNFGMTRPFWAWFYEATRMPLVPVYGSFPVKLRTYIGSAVLLPSTASIEEIRSSSLHVTRPLLLSHTKLLLEGFGHFWWGWTGKTECNLDTVVDEPLKGSKSTDHDNSRTKTHPQSLESKSIDGVSDTGAGSPM